MTMGLSTGPKAAAHGYSRVRVYYEDTDLAGIVYYANYLKFIERGRSDWIRALGVDQVALRRDSGRVFAVRHLAADYFAPAHFDDELEVTTRLTRLTGARLHLSQDVLRGPERLFAAEVVLVCLGPGGVAARIPADLRRIFAALAE